MTREILHDLGFFGHYLHKHAGGRGGKQFVLATLHMSGGKLPQRDLLERTNTSPAALSEVLAKLEAEGLIAKEPHEHDKRQSLIVLTSKGACSAEQMCREREDFEAKALACLTPEEQQTLAGLIKTVRKHWESLEESEVRA